MTTHKPWTCQFFSPIKMKLGPKWAKFLRENRKVNMFPYFSTYKRFMWSIRAVIFDVAISYCDEIFLDKFCEEVIFEWDHDVLEVQAGYIAIMFNVHMTECLKCMLLVEVLKTYSSVSLVELSIGTLIWYVSYRWYFELIHNIYHNIFDSVKYGLY